MSLRRNLLNGIFVAIAVCCTSAMVSAQQTEKFFSAELMLWDLSPATNKVTTINENTGVPLLFTDDADPDVSLLPRLTAGWQRGCDTAELTYWGLGDWNNSATVTGNNNLSLPGAVALATLDFFNADRMTITDEVDMHNLEANAWRNIGGSELLLGFRYVNFDETFNINSFDAGSGTSDYRIDAENNVFAVQTGARLHHCINGWHLQGLGKVGIGITDAEQNTFLGDFNNTAVIRRSRTDETEFAFLAELGAKISRHLTHNTSLTIGYDVFWLDNIARGANQLDFSDVAGSGTQLHTKGRAFLHGGSIGLVTRW